jgi:hypothetical protein
MSSDYDSALHVKNFGRVVNWNAVRASRYMAVPNAIRPIRGSGVCVTATSIARPANMGRTVGIRADGWMDNFRSAVFRNQPKIKIFASDNTSATWVAEYCSIGIVKVALMQNVQMGRRKINLDAPCPRSAWVNVITRAALNPNGINARRIGATISACELPTIGSRTCIVEEANPNQTQHAKIALRRRLWWISTLKTADVLRDANFGSARYRIGASVSASSIDNMRVAI